MCAGKVLSSVELYFVHTARTFSMQTFARWSLPVRTTWNREWRRVKYWKTSRCAAGIEWSGALSLQTARRTQKRIDGFLASYAPIKDRAFPFIQDINAGERIIANHVQGYLQVKRHVRASAYRLALSRTHSHSIHQQTRVVYFLMNLVHIAPRRIYLSRVARVSRAVLH